jgi:TolB protein
VDGTGLERVTWADGFAAFPMFTRDGKRLVFCGSRGAASPRGLEVLTADWNDSV